MRRDGLLRRLREVDGRRLRLLEDVEALDEDVRTRRPAPDRWAIAEIVEHLVVAERYVLRGLPDPGTITGRRRTLRNRFFYHVVAFVLGAPIRVDAPVRAMLPTGNVSLPELRRTWDENHAWLRRYVETRDDAGLRNAVFRHPVSGPLTTPQVIRLLDLHLRRHTRQIHRLIADG